MAKKYILFCREMMGKEPLSPGKTGTHILGSVEWLSWLKGMHNEYLSKNSRKSPLGIFIIFLAHRSMWQSQINLEFYKHARSDKRKYS